ncbi:MAG: VWA domain-containing protein [Vicinamibacterales bacterium]
MRTLITRTGLLLAALTLAVQGVPVSGQQQGGTAAQGGPPAQTPPPVEVPGQDVIPTFRSGINFVRVDAIVTDRKGEPVDDLTIDDFQIQEDGAPQTIEQFKLIRVDKSSRPPDEPIREIRDRDDVEREAAYDDVRVFVFFFDDYHTRDLNAMSIRRYLQEFVATQLRPADMVAFMYPLSPLDTITFTRDQRRIASAIDRFVGRKYKYEPLNVFEQRYANAPTEQVEMIRNQVVVGALRGLATFLGGIGDGRKAIIYVGEGLSTSLPPSMRNQNAQFANPLSARQDSPIEDTAAFFNYTDVLQRVRDITDAANRTNTSFYTVDPRGLAVSEFQIDEIASFEADRRILQQTQDILRTFAEQTDGRAIVGRNDIAKGLAQAVKDSSAYYLLGYNSTQAPSDGRFHTIKVTLSERARRRGLQLRARRGYLAPTAEDVRRVTAAPVSVVPKPVAEAVASLSARPASHQVARNSLVASRGRDGKTAVTFLWEALPAIPGARREPPARVSLIAATAAGSLVFRGKVPAVTAPPSAGSPPAPAGSVSFEAAPGPLQLRISVESESGSVLDSEIREWVVPPVASGLSTPRVFRARTVRDVQTLVRDWAALPTLSREFFRAERVLVRVEAYDGAPTAVLLNRAGERMAEVPVQALTAPAYYLELVLAALAPGEYLIELASGSARELVPLKVGA